MPDAPCPESLPNTPCTLPAGHAGQHLSAAGWRWHSPDKAREMFEQQRPGKEPSS
jgi:hypothetical protein